MFRRVAATLAPAAAAAATVPFGARFDELEQDPKSMLNYPEYKFLKTAIADYQELQSRYAVKQDDMERTRKVANFCGLDFDSPAKRKEEFKLKREAEASGEATKAEKAE